MKFGLFFLGEYTPHDHDQLPDGRSCSSAAGTSRGIADADGAAGSSKLIVFAVKMVVLHPVLHADPLDDPALPLRPADGPGVEGADPAGAGQPGAA